MDADIRWTGLGFREPELFLLVSMTSVSVEFTWPEAASGCSGVSSATSSCTNSGLGGVSLFSQASA